MRMKATLPAILAAVSILTACNGLVGRGDGDDNRFSAFTDLPGEGWFYTDHLEFVPDTLRDSLVSRGTMLISVRHGKDYLYRNLWLEISYADTDSTRRGPVERPRHGAVDGSTRYRARSISSCRAPRSKSPPYHAVGYADGYRTHRCSVCSE